MQQEIDAYGVLLSRPAGGATTQIVIEEIETLGVSVVRNYLPLDLVEACRDQASRLLERNSQSADPDIVRAPWAAERLFLQLAQLPLIHEVLKAMIPGRHVLNQQNLVRNPANGQRYSQGRFHRDLPYQHFVASRPLALNVLVLLDDWTASNGATKVLPASHKEERFPSPEYVKRHAFTVEAPKGSLLILHAMTYHAGSVNRTNHHRLGVNNVFASPIIRPQLNHSELASFDLLESLSTAECDLLDIRPLTDTQSARMT